MDNLDIDNLQDKTAEQLKTLKENVMKSVPKMFKNAETQLLMAPITLAVLSSDLKEQAPEIFYNIKKSAQDLLETMNRESIKLKEAIDRMAL